MKSLLQVWATVSLIFLPTVVQGDQRYYTFTYQPFIEVDGELDVEYYLTLINPSRHDHTKDIWEHQLELEYGISQHMDFALYQSFEESSNGWHYKGFKMRFRYMPWKKHEKVVDTVLYAEYIHPREWSRDAKVEVKLILGKEQKNWDWAFNYSLEQPISFGNEKEHQINFAISYALHSSLRVGMESWAKWEDHKSPYYIGPALSFGSPGFWITTTVAYGITEESHDIMARMILGFPLPQ